MPNILNYILMTIISRHINTVLLLPCQTQVLILHVFNFPTAQQDDGEGNTGRGKDDCSHQDFSLSRVGDLRKMLHKAVMKDGNVFILSVVFTFLTQSFIPSPPL